MNEDWERWGPNPLGISESMIRNAAEELRKDHDQEHDSSHLSWQDFAGQALRVLTVGLKDTRWEDY